MKKIMRITVMLIVTILLSIQSISIKAQLCIPDNQLTSGTNLTLQNSTDFYIYYDGVGGLDEYYAHKCGINIANFRNSFLKGVNKDLEITFQVWGQEFNCSGIPITAWTMRSYTPIELYTGPSTSLIEKDLDVTISENTRYVVYTKFRKKKLIGWGNWETISSTSLRFIKSSEAPSPAGSFSDLLSTESRTSTGTGWTVDVHQLDISGAFDFDASATGCENSYYFEISRFNLDAWSQSNVEVSGWIAGEAGVIDMDAFYSFPFQRGELYKLKLVAGAGWFVKDFWFEIKDAQIAGSVSHLNAYATPIYDIFGATTYFLYYEVCDNAPVYLYTDGTESYDQYQIKVEELDVYYNPTGLFQNSGPQTGVVPSAYNLNTLYGAFDNSQRYKVTYEVGNPLIKKEFYLKPVSCPGITGGGGNPQGGNNGSGNNANQRKKKLEITSSISEFESSTAIYPNPTKGEFTVSFENEEAHAVNVEVLDLEGKTIHRSSSMDKQVEFNLNDHPNGVYLVRINTNNKVIVKKVMKH